MRFTYDSIPVRTQAGERRADGGETTETSGITCCENGQMHLIRQIREPFIINRKTLTPCPLGQTAENRHGTCVRHAATPAAEKQRAAM
ncbi:hypothetical protein [Singulisphaera acidiphila]|uniref:hypothetical protein n=1 Tax=Singulisphaera acidiphila TaxID=466153 RepID=UPI0012B5D556|nr:hypothetical protein [Singulisphaera acidiphila]